MSKPSILFIQGGGDNAHTEDKKLAGFLQRAMPGCTVHYPLMPGEADPHYENYKVKIADELKRLPTVILVGHSVGACFLLKYLSEENYENNIAGVFLLATPFWGKGGWQYEGFGLRDDFVSKLPANVPIFFYHGTSDEVVPFAHLALYTKKIPGATIREVQGVGHQFNNNLAVVVNDIKSTCHAI